MNNLSTPIIPVKPTFYGVKKEIDYRAVCIYSALGFFLDSDTFWSDKKTLPVASDCILDKEVLISSKPNFSWHYSPRNISLAQAADEFTELFENIIQKQTSGKKVILALSGGLDSRTQAAALKNIGADVNSYSYYFQGGLDETKYSADVADAQNFPFESWVVKPGYLWNCIDELAGINDCYAEFTHPRQMAFVKKYKNFGDVFSLGHMGDLLFDDMSVPDDLPFDEQLKLLVKLLVKKGGLELGATLWKVWEIEGCFEEYLYERIKALYFDLDILNSANARLRAFKSKYYVPRWTNINLAVFASAKPVTLPYYDNRMCEFVCTVPEAHLSGRKIQIEYLRRRAPELAKITWEKHRPFNLFNYQWDKPPWNLPFRAFNKSKRIVSAEKYIQRNWELQFLGQENDKQLKVRLFDEPKLTEWIPKSVIENFYNKFKTVDSIFYSHSVSMLLTLSLFSKHFKESKDEEQQLV